MFINSRMDKFWYIIKLLFSNKNDQMDDFTNTKSSKRSKTICFHLYREVQKQAKLTQEAEK